MRFDLRLQEIIFIDDNQDVQKTYRQHKGRLSHEQASELIGGFDVKSVQVVHHAYDVPYERLSDYDITQKDYEV